MFYFSRQTISVQYMQGDSLEGVYELVQLTNWIIRCLVLWEGTVIMCPIHLSLEHSMSIRPAKKDSPF